MYKNQSSSQKFFLNRFTKTTYYSEMELVILVYKTGDFDSTFRDLCSLLPAKKIASPMASMLDYRCCIE